MLMVRITTSTTNDCSKSFTGQLTGITLSGDGTSHRHIQHDARTMFVNKGASHSSRYLGVTTEVNHSTATQLEGLRRLTFLFYEIYNASPRGHASPEDPRTLFLKTYGMMTDHAEDQKCLVRRFQEVRTMYDREVRGEEAMRKLSLPELLLALAEATMEAVQHAGGEQAWAALSPNERAVRNQEIEHTVVLRLGEEAYLDLSDEERQLASDFASGGCCMHKDLNAAKGAHVRMNGHWVRRGLTPPVYLMNRDNAAAAALGNSAARARAIEKSTGGGVKLTELAGALFRHKDDKKGQQDSMRFFFELSWLGRLLTFPDTSNTRFGSHGDAASMLLAYLPLFCEYLELIRDKKENGQWNHLEENVYLGLHDIPTLTELVAMSIYSQVVSHPYMRCVRSHDDLNHLDLAPLHDRVIVHIDRILDNPTLVLGDDSEVSPTQEDGTLDGQLWDFQDAFTGIQKILPILPDVRSTLVEYLEGAKETWKRFGAEFAPGGTIARLSKEQRERAWMPPTNDLNEGLLGRVRVKHRAEPNESESQFNAQAMYQHNDTAEFVTNSLEKADLDYAMQVTREREALGLERKRRRTLAEGEKEEANKRIRHRKAVETKKTERLDRLKAIIPILRLQELKSNNTTVAKITEQLDWHREWVDTQDNAERAIPRKKDLPNKAAILNALREAVKRYNSSPIFQELAVANLAKVNVDATGSAYTRCADEVEVEDEVEDEEAGER